MQPICSRKRLYLLLVMLLSIQVVVAEDIEVVVYADEGYAPYSYRENNEMKGLYTQILSVAFSRIPGYRVHIKAVPWKRGLAVLENGTGFALYPPYFHIESRPYIWPYSLPILDEKVVLFCGQEVMAQSTRTRWPEDYYGLTIGNNSGFLLGGEAFWQAVKEQKIFLEEAKSNEQNLIKLGLKRIDCYMNDRLSILIELNRLKRSGKYDYGGRHTELVEGATISIEQGFLGFSAKGDERFPFKDDFVKKFDQVIYQMRQQGELEKIIQSFVAQ